MSVYSFTGTANSYLGPATIELRFAYTNVTPNTWLSKLNPIDWNSGVINCSDFIFSLPEIMQEGEYEVGLIQNSNISFECPNVSVATDTSPFSIRIYDIFQYNPYEESLEVRLKVTYPTSVTPVYYRATVDHNSLVIRYGEFANKDTWFYKFDCVSTLSKFKDVDTVSWLGSQYGLQHQYNDYKATKLYLTFVGDNTSILNNGSYEVESYMFYDYSKAPEEPEKVVHNIDTIRFIKLVDVFNTMSTYLGYTVTVNNSESWTANVSSIYSYTTDGVNLTQCTIDELYILSGFFFASLGEYDQFGTFFDQTKKATISVCNFNKVLDALKAFCISLGLTCLVETNSSGSEYLRIKEAGHSTLSLTGSLSNSDKISWGSEITPFEKKIDGIKINDAFDHSFIKGIVGDNINIDCMFCFPNIVRQWYTETSDPIWKWRVYPSNFGFTKLDSGKLSWLDRGMYEVMGSLFGSHNPTISGTRNYSDGDALVINNLYSICSITPAKNGLKTPDVDNITLFPSGPYSQGYGYYDSTIGGWTYPDPADPTGANNKFTVEYAATNIPQIALGHYYYALCDESVDTVALYRKYQRKMTIEYSEPLYNVKVGQELRLTIDGFQYKFYVSSISIDLKTMVTKLELLSRTPTYK